MSLSFTQLSFLKWKVSFVEGKVCNISHNGAPYLHDYAKFKQPLSLKKKVKQSEVLCKFI